MEIEEGESERRLDPGAKDVEEYLEALIGDPELGWDSNQLLEFSDSTAWQPKAVNSSQKTILHGMSAAPLRYLARRVQAARNDGYKMHVVVPLTSLYDDEIVEFLTKSDADVSVVGTGELDADVVGVDVWTALTSSHVPLSREARTSAVENAMQFLDVGAEHERGRRLESLIAFVLAQISSLSVFSRNYSNANQEIDVVLRVDNTGRHCWCIPGAPFVLVESKNTKAKGDAPQISILFDKLATRGGRAQIGIFVARNGYTDGARTAVLRHSTDSLNIALLDEADLRTIGCASDPDDALDQLIGQAMLA